MDRARKRARRSLFYQIGGDTIIAVIYCRVDGPSNPFSVDAIRGQEIQLRSYAKENGIEVTGISLDVGFSGRKLDRPGLCSVLRAVKDWQADTVLVVNHNRLFRGQYPKELKGLPVIALQEQIQKNEEGSRMKNDPMLTALLSQPWSNNACRGYVIYAMENCGFSHEDIRRVVGELHYVFDFKTLEEAQHHYENGSY